MSTTVDAYLEAGKKRVFAGALEWPGWCRAARDDDAALEALAVYAPRYAAALGRAGIKPPPGRPAFRVVERLKGDATTDFGAPGTPPRFDSAPLARAGLKRPAKILEASWSAFDAAAKHHARATLSTGPRGGGRSLGKIVAHVLEADAAYLSRLGGRYRTGATKPAEDMRRMRAAFLEMLAFRAEGGTPEKGRRTAPLWTPRYAIRRSAWHALDHAWEIEDRAG